MLKNWLILLSVKLTMTVVFCLASESSSLMALVIAIPMVLLLEAPQALLSVYLIRRFDKK